jgi:hypothetical protein
MERYSGVSYCAIIWCEKIGVPFSLAWRLLRMVVWVAGISSDMPVDSDLLFYREPVHPLQRNACSSV